MTDQNEKAQVNNPPQKLNLDPQQLKQMQRAMSDQRAHQWLTDDLFPNQDTTMKGEVVIRVDGAPMTIMVKAEKDFYKRKRELMDQLRSLRDGIVSQVEAAHNEFWDKVHDVGLTEKGKQYVFNSTYSKQGVAFIHALPDRAGIAATQAAIAGGGNPAAPAVLTPEQEAAAAAAASQAQGAGEEQKADAGEGEGQTAQGGDEQK